MQGGGKRLRGEELHSAMALALSEVSGSSISGQGLGEKTIVLASTPDGPEPKRRRTKRNAIPVPSILALKVLLPNKTTVRLQVAKEHPLSLKQLLRRLEQHEREVGEYPVNWEGDLWLQDPTDKAVPAIRSDEALASLFQSQGTRRTLLLVDGDPNAAYGDKELWNITPQPAIMTRLPQGYNLATALADQVDNALQAVWSNVHGTRYVGVDIEPDKITIFDNGKGMTADEGPNSIAMWGTLGSSSHQEVHHQAMGGSQLRPPFLLPHMGKYGAGGVASACHLGGAGEVFSKTETATMVCSLLLNPKALDQRSKEEPDNRFWKVAGNLRHMSKTEKEKAPNGSFTKVELTKLRKHYSNTAHGDRKENEILSKELLVKQMLKDIYAPYIQCDDVATSRTTFPVIFEVNGQNLTEVEGGEVTISNRYSCPAEDFVVDLHFKKPPESNSAQPLSGVNAKEEAHARLCCQYFPNRKGKESLQSVLDELGSIRPGETFHSMARVTVRWLGRLLPETKWPLLPFMEVNPRRSRDGIRPQWAKRVKACLYTDAGFIPTQSKTELARDDPFTVAARYLGATEQELSKTSISGSGVKVYISRNNKSLTQERLVKDYMAWLTSRHETFDEEVSFGKNDAPVYVFKYKGLEDWCTRTDCSAGVFQFHRHMKDTKNDWDATSSGLRIKLQKGLCGLKRDLYATIEFFFHSGTDEEHGEVGMICRPMDVMDTDGSQIVSEGTDPVFHLGKSKIFPVSALMSEKTLRITEQQWQRKEEENKNKAPSNIALLSCEECRRLGINEAFPVEKSTVNAGYTLPTQFLAVVRAKHCNGASKQASICAEPMELKMRVAFSGSTDSEKKQLFALTCKAEVVSGVKGVYRFNIKEADFGGILEKEGNYVFTFSLVSEKFKEVPDQEYVLKVKAADQTTQWKISLNSMNSERARPTFRLDQLAPSSFLLRKLDKYGNVQEFKNQKEVDDLQLEVQVLAPWGGDLGIKAVRKMVSLTKDRRCALIKDLLLSGGHLSPIQPQHEALLRFQLPNFQSEDVGIQVLPGRLSSLELKQSGDFSNAHFKPEDVVKELSFQGLDRAGNKADYSQAVLVELVGLEFLTSHETAKRFHLSNDGCVDLGGLLKVTGAYGTSGSVTIMTEERSHLLRVPFKVVFRRLHLSSQVPDTVFLGQSLCGIVIEVVDEVGTVDRSVDGGIHNLQVNSNINIVFPLRSGTCNLPPIDLPSVTGPWYAEISHMQYPNLKIEVKVTIEMDSAVHLAAMPGQGDDIIPTRCGDSCMVKFAAIAASGQHGRLPRDVLQGLTMEATLLKLEGFQRSQFPLESWLLTDVQIRSLYDQGSMGYAASFKLTGPAGIYTLTLRGHTGGVSGDNTVRWSVRLRPGKPHKLAVFLSKPGYEAHHAESEPLSRLAVSRYRSLPSFVVHVVDASGNLCDEECFLTMEAQDCANWTPHSEKVTQGRAHFKSFGVDADIGNYVVCIRSSNPVHSLAPASFLLDVTPGNYPSCIRLRDPAPLAVTLSSEDVQYLPGMEVIVQTADGQILEQRCPLAVTISKARGVSPDSPRYFGELAQPIEIGMPSMMSFERVPVPFKAGQYQLRFSMPSTDQLPSVEPIVLPLTVHHGPPTGMEVGHDQHKLIVTVVDKHGNCCRRVSGLEITAQPVGRFQEAIAVVERGRATFHDLPFQTTEPKLQLRIFTIKQESLQFFWAELEITVVRNLPQAIQEQSEKIQAKQLQRREAQHAINARAEELRFIQADIATIEDRIKMFQEQHDRMKPEFQSDAEVYNREQEEPLRTDKDVYKDLQKHRGRKGYGAALAVFEASRLNGFLSPDGPDPAAADVLGSVATLGRVENNALNSILSEYVGLSMVHIVCKSERAVKVLQVHENGRVDRQRGLAAFARSRNYDLGKYSTVSLEYLTPFRRNDGQDNVCRGHPQQLLNIDPPQLPNNGGSPRGFLGYAVNLIHLQNEHLQIRIKLRGGQEVGLRESLFFDVYKYLMVFDQRDNVDAFKERGGRFQGAVSLDGGIWKSMARQELGESSRDVGLRYATVPIEERLVTSLLPPACDAFARINAMFDLRKQHDQQTEVLNERVVSKREVESILVRFQQSLAKVAEEEEEERRKVAQWEQAMDQLSHSGRLPAMEQGIYVLPH